MSSKPSNKNKANSGAKPPQAAISQDAAPVIGASFLQSGQTNTTSETAEVSPYELIAGASLGSPLPSDEEMDAAYNPPLSPTARDSVVVEGNLVDTHQMGAGFDLALEELDNLALDVPRIRKVVIRKIPKLRFRLGLEKQKGNPNLMPGVKHTFQVSTKGDTFITGLEDQPDKRRELEGRLKVDLGPKSKFWMDFVINLEDKEHGMALNFDDPIYGAHNELCYYALAGSDLVANGLQEYTSGEKAFAEWYIENKDAEAEALQKQIDVELKAGEWYKQFSEAKLMDIGKLCGAPVWGLTNRAAATEVYKWLKESYKNAERFCAIAEMKDSEFSVRVLVENAIKFNVFRKNGAHDWTFQNQVIGNNVDLIAKKLAQPAHQDLRLSITNMVNAKGRR